MTPRRHRPSTRSLAPLGVALLLAVGLVACGSGGSDGSSTTTTVAPKKPAKLAVPCGEDGDGPETYDHVVVMVEENRTWTGGRTGAVGMGFSADQMPYLHGLASTCSYYADWVETNVDDNSLNQYIGMTSGVANTSTVNDCKPSDTCTSTDDNIFRQVRESGGTARTYVDGATEPCSEGDNAAKHIPALYYQGGDDPEHCTEEVLPISELDPADLPTYAFIVPDLCNDGHDCGDDVVDDWAEQTLKPIIDGPVYAKGKTLIVVVYDEDQPVPNLFIAPTANEGRIASVQGSHASLLKTVELALGLPVLDQGQLPDATDLRESAGL